MRATRDAFSAQLALPPAVAAGVIPAPCPEPQAFCGYVPVPYDRKHPERGNISIYFEQYPHSAAGPAVSAILMNFGGPGVATTPGRDSIQSLFAPNIDVHDLLIVDDRGEGLSNAVNCPELQHGTTDFATALSDCAAELGIGDTLYDTADVAEDMDAVREALGYELIDYYGASYGGADAIAYATRFPRHTRSLVLDAPLGPPTIPTFKHIRNQVQSDPDMVRNVCERSLLCAPDHPAPIDEFSDLIESIRHHPIQGDTHDLFGNPTHVRIDETALLNFVVSNTGVFWTETGELLAAGAAMERGDHAPLLRIAAEGFFTLQLGDSGDPTFFSLGEFYARSCVDAGEPWDWLKSVPERERQYAEAVEDLPKDYFEPFSRQPPTDILFDPFGLQCVWWQKPVPAQPLVPSHAVYPAVPTLVLDGDLDNVIPRRPSRETAALFPRSTFVLVAGAGHETVNYGSCPVMLITNFIENLQPGDTSCAADAAYAGGPGIPAALGRFPLFAHDARAATVDPHGSNEIGEHERKVVSVAVATAIDAVRRAIISGGTLTSGVGLRGGSFQVTYPPNGSWVFALSNCEFSEDVIVNGSLTWAADYSVVADLAVSGPGTTGGNLHVQGAFEPPGMAPGYFKISGTLGGGNVAVLVPEG